MCGASILAGVTKAAAKAPIVITVKATTKKPTVVKPTVIKVAPSKFYHVRVLRYRPNNDIVFGKRRREF